MFISFDPRNSIREKIGVSWDVEEDGNIKSCVTIKDNNNDILYIPMLKSEEIKSNSLPAMPYIEMQLRKTYYLEHDIEASTRKMDSYIFVHAYFTDTDNIDRETCGKKIKDRLQNLVRTNQKSFTNITWINIDDDDYLPETTGNQLVYHYVMTIHALWYDICT